METIMDNHTSTNTLAGKRPDRADRRADRADRAAASSNAGLSLPRDHARPRLMATPFFRKKS